ncbi:oligoribonuclease [Pontibacillus halophilus JSM 076056 = DSM 19796]|uniref:Oligoribonuclease n=1 Tax=Pontibacillus halophilus JSM 076056 = DSM 19796 TaxID=1385510 RepID=A0A0A5GQ48_9BACI|nr:bifunctional oligoribonuclease/PAP phosphatase NrnA [Pontibacillus halophilus]KGX93368.1 oligoribonuclease [Pontibacillus halophilus JSM 076056 = DSM 19796]
MTKSMILEQIEKFDTIIIHRHVRPDPDALGSQAGLGKMIQASYPDKRVYLAGEEDPSLTFLVEMDEVADDVYEEALVVVCDTANRERISDERYHTGNYLVKIDHHPTVDEYGDLMWVDTNASSTSEMIYEMYEAASDKLTMTDEVARLLYAGIVGDTGRFLFPSTTKKTFQYAAELATYSFDRSALYNELYKMEHAVAHLKGYMLQNFTMSSSGLAHVKITTDILTKYDITPSQTSKLVGTLGDIDGIKSWVIFVEEEELIRVRLRSKGPVINDIAAKYNGGGHPMASGATIYKWEDVENVLADLEEVCRTHES